MLLVLVALAFSSCDHIEKLYQRLTASPSDAIVTIGDNHLYRYDIEQLVPAGTAPEDSAAIVDKYIRTWATDILMYRNAKRNVQNEDEIRRLLNDYERTITIHYYRQNMVRDKVGEPTDADAQKYWADHRPDFLLTEPVVKGIYLSLPLSTKNISSLRRQMKDPVRNIADIERFAHRNATMYSLFIDDWQYLSDIEKSTARSLPIKDKGFVEITDSASVNMIYITDYLPADSVTPLSIAMEDARIRLFQQRKMQYLRNIDNEIYQHAVSRGEIIFNNDTVR